MIEKTISTDSTFGIEKAVVKLTLPAIDVTAYKASSGSLNAAIKSQLLDIIGEIIDKQLE